MAKSRNNLLGVGGQRGKLPKPGQAGHTGPADRRAAEDHKQELARKMREKLTGTPQPDPEPESATDQAQASEGEQNS
ncbi:DUF6243 family protein [Streptomyces sp. NPDC049954]|uniref:DUF6243 family protein n=1 Tax=Streptomyces sp. NPDC049954 TaxID=3155779 RepID=UPI00342562AC